MGDPLNRSGNLVQAPVTHSEASKTQDVNSQGRKFNRTVSVVEATPQKGLRAWVKNFLPRPLYKFLVGLVTSSSNAQYKLGKAIIQARKDSADAWQKLGEFNARPHSAQTPKERFELQMDCRKKDLKLDVLQGWADSPVTAQKQTVIKKLERCIESPNNETFAKEYESACTKLKHIEHDQETLRHRRSKLTNDAKSIEPVLAAAKEINIRLSLEETYQLDSPDMTDEDRRRETGILDQAATARDRFKAIKKELAVIDADIKRYENSLVDDERAHDAVIYYENVEKNRNKGEK